MILDFGLTSNSDAQHGSTSTASLTTHVISPLLHNLTFGSNDFEFEGYTWTQINYGSTASAELTTESNRTYANIFNQCEYTVPKSGITFDLGYDQVEVIPGFGGLVDPTNYDLTFDPAKPIVNDPNLVFSPANDTLILSASWHYAKAISDSTVELDLTTDPRAHEYNIGIYSKPTGSTVKQINAAPTRVRNTDLEFAFDAADHPVLSLFPFEPSVIPNDVVMDINLSYDGIDAGIDPKADNTPNFNLVSTDTCGASFNLLPNNAARTISGKNINYDINLCTSDIVPTLDVYHNFKGHADYLDHECQEFIFYGYHGAVGEATATADLFINDIDGYSGAVGETDFATSVNLDPTAYHGAYTVVNLFNTYPAIELNANIYNGSYATTNFITISIFRDVLAEHGAATDFEISTYPAIELEINPLHGAINQFELLTAPVLQLETVLHGANVYDGLTTYPSIELDSDAFSGANVDVSLLVSALLSADSYHGSNSNADLDVIKSAGLGDVDAHDGSNTVVDLAYTPTIDSDAFHGGFVNIDDLKFGTTFDIDAFNGEYVESDLTAVPPKEFEPIAYHGGDGVTDMSVTKALFPRANHGVNLDIILTDFPASELTLDSYHGVYSDFDVVESEFNTFAYNGSTLDAELQVTVSFPLDDITHGSYSEIDEIFRATTLEPTAYNGSNGLFGLDVPQGESIIAEAFAGHGFQPDVHAPIHQQFKLHPIVASQTLYDGLGHVGGLNHCVIPEEKRHPIYGDNVTRLGFDPAGISDKLIIRFDDFGDDPWTACSGGGAKFEWELNTNARLEAHAYAGESVQLFIPMELMPLFGVDVPTDRLYHFEYWAVIDQDLIDVNFEVTHSAIAWNNPDDIYAFNAVHANADLTPTAYAQLYNGAAANAELAVPVYAWKTAQRAFEFGSNFGLMFEPIDYIRFCKGYITPNGNSVVFEFEDYEETDCSIFLAGHGQSIEYTTLATVQSFEPAEITASARLEFALTIDPLWMLWTRHGVNMEVTMYDPDIPTTTAHYGSYATIAFYDEPVEGGHGHYVDLDLAVPGPAVRWVTQTECLPNDYKPMTEDGDIDYDKLKPDEHGVEHYPTVPVENLPYLANLVAECVTYIEENDND